MTETVRRIDAGSALIPQARVVCETLVTRSAPNPSPFERRMNDSKSPDLPKMQESLSKEDNNVRRQISLCSCSLAMSIQSSSSSNEKDGDYGGFRDRDHGAKDAFCSFLEEDMSQGSTFSCAVEETVPCCQASSCESGVSSEAECNILLHGNGSDGWGGESKLRLVTGESPWKYWRLSSIKRGIPAFIFAKDAERGRLFVHGTEGGRLRLIKSSLPDPESVDVDEDADDPRIFFHVYSHQRDGGFLVPSVFYNDDVPERSVSVDGTKVVLSDHDENTSDLWVVEDS